MLACSDSPADVGSTTTALISVTPASGAAAVSTSSVIEIRFGQPVDAGGTALIALQIGDCPGPIVAGTWSSAEGGTVLRFQPTGALEPGTLYTIHVGGGMRDSAGAQIDLEENGEALGGVWITQAQVMGMTAMGMIDLGTGAMVSHAGAGWRHPNGFFGLGFAFTTAG